MIPHVLCLILVSLLPPPPDIHLISCLPRETLGLLHRAVFWQRGGGMEWKKRVGVLVTGMPEGARRWEAPAVGEDRRVGRRRGGCTSAWRHTRGSETDGRGTQVAGGAQSENVGRGGVLSRGHRRRMQGEGEFIRGATGGECGGISAAGRRRMGDTELEWGAGKDADSVGHRGIHRRGLQVESEGGGHILMGDT